MSINVASVAQWRTTQRTWLSFNQLYGCWDILFKDSHHSCYMIAKRIGCIVYVVLPWLCPCMSDCTMLNLFQTCQGQGSLWCLRTVRSADTSQTKWTQTCLGMEWIAFCECALRFRKQNLWTTTGGNGDRWKTTTHLHWHGQLILLLFILENHI